jgi:ligand-binding sensor domain-containing protein
MSSKKHILNFEDDYLNDYHAIAIHSIIEDKKGNMWFTTDKNGVYCYDGKTFKHYIK